MASGYQLKITIKDSHPPIWRRVIVPENITFNDLDDIIEALFGWEHDHMFSFYTKKFYEYISGSPMHEPGEETDESIDEWIDEGETFLYIYDFGDNWEHTVKVEKIIEYDSRSPRVLKYKGPNMIEDCGGIWGFEECREEAAEFDMEEVNALFSSWNFPVVVPDAVGRWKRSEEEQKLPKELYKDDGEEYGSEFEKILNEFAGREDMLREISGEISSLTDVFQYYSKDNLKGIAKIHGFTRYSQFNKKELAEWLKNHLLETRYMREMLEKSGEEEFLLFEEAIEENGISISEELVEKSLLLCSYGGYNANVEFYQVPLDVQEKFRKIVTPEFRERKEKIMNFISWCDAVLYLYGVIPIQKFAEIYNIYENTNLTENELEEKIRVLIQDGEPYAVREGYFMYEDLEEHDSYRVLLKDQGDCEYYLPKDREEFLGYGKYECQQPDENVQFFMDYLQHAIHMELPHALMVYYQVQDAIRDNAEDLELIQIMDDWGCEITSQSKMKKIMDLLRRLGGCIRKWEYRGHTPNELKKTQMKNRQKSGGNGKIIPFASAKKIYPNDPCPCGSGKKYKHCCGRGK